MLIYVCWAFNIFIKLRFPRGVMCLSNDMLMRNFVAKAFENFDGKLRFPRGVICLSNNMLIYVCWAFNIFIKLRFPCGVFWKINCKVCKTSICSFTPLQLIFKELVLMVKSRTVFHEDPSSGVN